MTNRITLYLLKLLEIIGSTIFYPTKIKIVSLYCILIRLLITQSYETNRVFWKFQSPNCNHPISSKKFGRFLIVQLRNLANFSFFFVLAIRFFRYKVKYIRILLLLFTRNLSKSRSRFHHLSLPQKYFITGNMRNYGWTCVPTNQPLASLWINDRTSDRGGEKRARLISSRWQDRNRGRPIWFSTAGVTL